MLSLASLSKKKESRRSFDRDTAVGKAQLHFVRELWSPHVVSCVYFYLT